MPIAALKQTWRNLVSRYCNDEQLLNHEFDHLVANYSGTGRYYHDLGHLAALLALQQEYAGAIRNNEVVLLAIFYHDLVYNVLQTDNEEQSALAAGRFLQQTTFPAYQVITVMDYIRATKAHRGDVHDDDLNLFLDFDLSILGSDSARYREYAQQVRQEYSVYPDAVYQPGRKQVLAHFLEQPFIYKTAAFREKYEAKARENIAAELAPL